MFCDEFSTNNCALVKYTDIRTTHGGLLVPRRKYELYLIDAVEVKENDAVDHGDDFVFCELSFDDVVYYINECYYFEQYCDLSDALIESTLFTLGPELARVLIDLEPCQQHMTVLQDIVKTASSTYPRTFMRLNSLSAHRDVAPDELIESWRQTPRITNTIKLMLKYSSPIYLVARKWYDIDPDDEFRLFVYRGRLTAISQYNTNALECRDVTRCHKVICDAFDMVKKILPYEDCTMDVWVRPDWTVKIIEFGPFGIDMNAGACYYNWLQDAHILYNWRVARPDIRVAGPEWGA